MLTYWLNDKDRFCDGISRRGFLKLGALGAGAFTLADLLRSEAEAGIGSSNKAIINIHLSGGPSHQDIFDLKPEAPSEFRGEFSPISTNVPGMQICEHLPKLAQLGDKFAVVRSLVGSSAGHSNFQTHSGFNQKSLSSLGGRPSIGAVVSRLQGAERGAPPWVSFNGGPHGFLGPTYRSFEPAGRSSALANLSLQRGMDADRLNDRVDLLKSLDRIRRDVDASGQMDALDRYTQTAVEVVTSGRIADALDLKKEDPRVVEMYGRTGQTLLKARRLIQAGCRVVTTNASFGGWDTHGDNFNKLRRNLPLVDEGMSALINDLSAQGMLDDVLIVMWGEFGRTPRVDNDAGRNHWPQVSMAFLAGGGLQTGQMIGATDRIAAYAAQRPVHYQEVHATMYHQLGIDTRNVTIVDPAGRPQYLLEHRNPIDELI